MTIVKEASYFKTAFYGAQIHGNYQRKRENRAQCMVTFRRWMFGLRLYNYL